MDSPASGPAPAAIFTLTLRADTIQTQADNAIFNAPLVSQVATLQTGDSIIDSGTGGRLNAVFNPVAVNLIGAAVHGVAAWNLTNVGTWGASQWITGGSLVSGLVTLNAVDSNAPLVVGVPGAALAHALTAVGLIDTASDLNALIAASALSGSGNALGINLHNAGTSNVASVLTVGPDSNSPNGYETWNLHATGNNWVALSQGSATSVTAIAVSGSGSLNLSGSANGFPNLVSINLTSFAGTATITGF